MEYKADFLANMDALGRLDLIFAKTKLARRYGCRRPVFSRDGSITLRGLRHPQVAEDLLARGEAFTPLDLELNKGCTVITGANMGGKTVSLRAVTLSLLLCQCGFFVFAARAELPLFHRAALILADSGPGSGGLSSFGGEVHALDALLRESRGTFFFLALDEFARGTNPQEGAALARTLVQYLNGLHCVALMTTHYDGDWCGRSPATRETTPGRASPGGWITASCQLHPGPPAPGTPCVSAACWIWTPTFCLSFQKIVDNLKSRVIIDFSKHE